MTLSRLAQYLPVFVLVAVFGGLAWLNRREDVEHIRLALAALIAIAGLAYLWRGRKGFWRPLLAVISMSGALVVLYATSPDARSREFEAFIGRFFGVGLAALLAWVWVRLILPRLDARYQANVTMLFSTVVSGALVLTLLSIWLQAVNINAWRKAPVVSTGEAFRAELERPWGARPNGIFVVGELVHPARSESRSTGQKAYLAYYNAAYRFGGQLRRADYPVWFPVSLELRLADETPVQTAGVTDFRHAIAWPECGPHPHQRCLQAGDRVVIHADPYQLKALSTGATRPALHDVRAIVHGDMQAVETAYLKPAIGMARLYGWLALALAPFGLLPGVVGVRRGLWLRRNGSDRAPEKKVTWS